jgi:DNA-binding response OmpR family regulator
MKVVMIVDDDDEAREALGAILAESGYRVLQAEHGAAAWKLLEGSPGGCDLILLDLMMPVMNGWDFRRKQRLDPRFVNIPVLMMSAGAHIAAVADDLGATDYIPKPIDIDVLVEKVKRHAR